MSKKSMIYFVMLAITPYIAVIPLFILFFGSEKLWHLLGNSAYNLFIPIALFIFFTFVLTIICFVFSQIKKWDAYVLTRAMAIIKVIHIPAYITIFVVGAFCALTVFSLPFTLLLAFFDYILLFMSGIMTVSAVILAINQNPQLSKKYYFLAALQFVYCVDLVATWILYLKLKREKQMNEISLHNIFHL